MSDDIELATPEDRRYLEGLVSGLDLAHAVALRLGDQAIAERVAGAMSAPTKNAAQAALQPSGAKSCTSIRNDGPAMFIVSPEHRQGLGRQVHTIEDRGHDRTPYRAR